MHFSYNDEEEVKINIIPNEIQIEIFNFNFFFLINQQLHVFKNLILFVREISQQMKRRVCRFLKTEQRNYSNKQ